MKAVNLNLTCPCESTGAPALSAFYSNAPVFVSAAHRRQMDGVISAVHRVVALPGYQDAVLAEAPVIARHPQRAKGVFAGFDFHVGADGPKLIEINSNAGGAMLNVAADWQHPECCRAPNDRSLLESAFISMFRNEWQLARGDRALQTLAIVDDRPSEQFLFPEFRLFQELFRSQGIDARIVDAAQLALADGQLRAGDWVIDLVYNRVTDFYFDDAAHAGLREAYLSDVAVITPHPRAHALFADKHNLVRFTDAEFLRTLGAHERDIETLLAGIPVTRAVRGSPESWWQDRTGWFFKPAAGFASKGAYRGDKITRRAFADVMQGDYVAQKVAPPGERLRKVAGGDQRFKVDLRHYVYDGATQLMAARLYQGQTTNFRTVGGGFAPVIELPDASP